MSTGTNGPSAPSEVRSFTSANPPAAPVLTLPAANALTTDYTPTLKWNAVTVPTGTTFASYEVQVDDDSAFGSLDFHDETTLTAVSSTQIDTTALASNKKFYWRVRAVNSDGESIGWSAPRYFRTALEIPNLVSPAEAWNATDLRPTFDWDDVAGAAGYTIQISRNNIFTSLAVTGSSSVSSFTPTVGLPANIPLYWRVMATGTNGPSAPSAMRSFTSANPPAIPVLVLPAANALTTDYTPTLKWNNVSLPTGTAFTRYEVQVDDDPAFGSLDFHDETTLMAVTSTQIDTTALAPNTRF